ncbi:MAG: DUF5104 domain-containing protein [Coriobacteriales bacterium]|jgi:hypothetical protein|nr:DUF5104 domain-containing protein [Coriobacteriales bacterium]
MKKAILIIEAVLLMFALSACEGSYKFINEHAEADKIAQNVMTAIENKDGYALAALFSDKTLDSAYDLEEGMNYSFDLYQGECLGVERDPAFVSEGHFEPNNYWRQIRARYKITTSEGVYWLYFVYVFVDQADPNVPGDRIP